MCSMRHLWVKTSTVHPQQLPQVLLGTEITDKATSPACQKTPCLTPFLACGPEGASVGT